jgi:hypothetical protein
MLFRIVLPLGRTDGFDALARTSLQFCLLQIRPVGQTPWHHKLLGMGFILRTQKDPLFSPRLRPVQTIFYFWRPFLNNLCPFCDTTVYLCPICGTTVYGDFCVTINDLAAQMWMCFSTIQSNASFGCDRHGLHSLATIMQMMRVSCAGWE